MDYARIKELCSKAERVQNKINKKNEELSSLHDELEGIQDEIVKVNQGIPEEYKPIVINE